MAQLSSLHIGAAPTADELSAMRRAVEPAAVPHTTRPNIGGINRAIFSNDGQTVETQVSRGPTQVEIANRAPGRVTINGIETTREAAIAAGFLSDEAGSPNPAGTRREGDAPPEDEPAKAADAADAPAEIKEAISILSQVAETQGSDVVEATLQATVESGIMPERLPDGVTAEQAQAVMTGYTAMANHALSSIGASVPLLEAMLSEPELADARRATVTNNHGWLRDIGRDAVSKLETLPSRNPAKFTALLATLDAEHRKAVVQKDGRWVVRLSGPEGEVSWGNAVRLGKVTF